MRSVRARVRCTWYFLWVDTNEIWCHFGGANTYFRQPFWPAECASVHFLKNNLNVFPMPSMDDIASYFGCSWLSDVYQLQKMSQYWGILLWTRPLPFRYMARRLSIAIVIKRFKVDTKKWPIGSQFSVQNCSSHLPIVQTKYKVFYLVWLRK